ncbi:MAG: hypothetical protein GMKNLPBB_03356 [Myxococcota bacterium]|nr:hypothetical protein [Myxococcota bacterium]
MLKKIGLLATCLSLFGLASCAGFAFNSRGVTNAGIFNSTSANERVTENAIGSKTGEGCAMSILGIVTLGDASVREAAKKGGISKVGTVDHNHMNILGVYANYCVVVSGD